MHCSGLLHALCLGGEWLKVYEIETRGQQLFYYTYSEPRHVILSKILQCIADLVDVALFTIFLGSIIQNQSMFILVLLLGSSGLSSICFSFCNCITGK